MKKNNQSKRQLGVIGFLKHAKNTSLDVSHKVNHIRDKPNTVKNDVVALTNCVWL